LARELVTQFTYGYTRGKPPEVPDYPGAAGRGPTEATPASDPLTALTRFGQDLTRNARDGELYPAVGREQEIEAVIQTLSQSPGRIPLLAGPPAARATVIDGLAQRIVSGKVPDALKDAQVWCRDTSATTAAGQSADEALAAEAKAHPGLILVLDELPLLAADPQWRPLLTGGSQRIIGLATLAAYRERAATDSAFAQRIRLIQVPEMTTAYAVGKLRIALRAAAQAATSDDSRILGLPVTDNSWGNHG
jgi:ATP-dependent Clp protease ATP-binding subunit ClpA